MRPRHGAVHVNWPSDSASPLLAGKVLAPRSRSSDPPLPRFRGSWAAGDSRWFCVDAICPVSVAGCNRFVRICEGVHEKGSGSRSMSTRGTCCDHSASSPGVWGRPPARRAAARGPPHRAAGQLLSRMLFLCSQRRMKDPAAHCASFFARKGMFCTTLSRTHGVVERARPMRNGMAKRATLTKAKASAPSFARSSWLL